MCSDRGNRLILRVEIDRAADPLAGVVRGDSHGPGEAFVGWMGLTRAIELALDRSAREQDPQTEAKPRDSRAGGQD